MSTLQCILVSVAIEALGLLGILVAITWTCARTTRTNRRVQRRMWAALLPEALMGRRYATQPISRSLRTHSDLVAFRAFVDGQIDDPRMGSCLALRHLCRHIGFTEWLEDQTRTAKDQLERAAAARTLALLKERVLREPIAQLLRSDDPAVVLAAGYASASFRDPSCFLTVLRWVYEGTPITLHGLAEMLSGFGEGICPCILATLDRLLGRCRRGEETVIADRYHDVASDDVFALVVMTDLLAFFKYRPAADTVVGLLEVLEDDEARIHLVKALGALEVTWAVPALVALLEDPNWILRSQAARALSALRATETIPLVEAMLNDENVRVRDNARRALASLTLIPAARTSAKVPA